MAEKEKNDGLLRRFAKGFALVGKEWVAPRVFAVGPSSKTGKLSARNVDPAQVNSPPPSDPFAGWAAPQISLPPDLKQVGDEGWQKKQVAEIQEAIAERDAAERQRQEAKAAKSPPQTDPRASQPAATPPTPPAVPAGTEGIKVEAPRTKVPPQAGKAPYAALKGYTPGAGHETWSAWRDNEIRATASGKAQSGAVPTQSAKEPVLPNDWRVKAALENEERRQKLAFQNAHGDDPKARAAAAALEARQNRQAIAALSRSKRGLSPS